MKDYLAFAAQKYFQITLTAIQQERILIVASPLFLLSVNYGLIFDLWPDFLRIRAFNF